MGEEGREGERERGKERGRSGMKYSGVVHRLYSDIRTSHVHE